jgi:hypothetical protein
MNFDRRLITQPGFHGVPPSGLDTALIGFHPVFQYALCASTNPFKCLVALVAGMSKRWSL